MKLYSNEINRMIWIGRFKKIFIFSLLLILLLLAAAFVFVEPGGKEIDGVVVGVTRSQTTLSSGIVLIVDIGESSDVMIQVPSISMPKEGQKVRLIVMNTIIPDYKRYKFLGYKVAKKDTQ